MGSLLRRDGWLERVANVPGRLAHGGLAGMASRAEAE
jgi:hypothetical protein